MKIRQGFVSNSSSSSFCIFGSWFDRDEVMKIYNHITKGNVEYKDDEDLDNVDELGRWEISETIDDALPKKFHCQHPIGYYDFDGLYIGVNPDNIDTGKTIDEQVEEWLEEIKKVLPEDVNFGGFSFHHDGGYDG